MHNTSDSELENNIPPRTDTSNKDAGSSKVEKTNNRVHKPVEVFSEISDCNSNNKLENMISQKPLKGKSANVLSPLHSEESDNLSESIISRKNALKRKSVFLSTLNSEESDNPSENMIIDKKTLKRKSVNVFLSDLNSEESDNLSESMISRKKLKPSKRKSLNVLPALNSEESNNLSKSSSLSKKRSEVSHSFHKHDNESDRNGTQSTTNLKNNKSLDQNKILKTSKYKTILNSIQSDGSDDENGIEDGEIIKTDPPPDQSDDDTSSELSQFNPQDCGKLNEFYIFELNSRGSITNPKIYFRVFHQC